ncbi:ABC-three component system middle component 8 [Ruegeria pomeroyi]
MLRPSKHSHPDLTVMNMAYLLLARLKKTRSEEYSALLRYATRSYKGGEALFLPSLSFLFLLGLVKYHAKGDRFEYVGAT